jgi:transitional endoplasmic reticulum ATPase
MPMRLTLRSGTDDVARADAALLAAMGLPGGGVVRVGNTHALVRPGDVRTATEFVASPEVIANAGLAFGASVDVVRVNLPPATMVTIGGESLPVDTRHLARALHGRPVTIGDHIAIPATETQPATTITIAAVTPNGAALVGGGTLLQATGAPGGTSVVTHDPGVVPGDGPTTAAALVAGLEAELDTLTGWVRLLTGADALPEAWGLPRVAGVLLAGPPGCGKSELVAAAAARAGATVNEVTVDLVFKPERLIDVLDQAVKTAPSPGVVFVDRIDTVAGADAMFRTQAAAIMRWFLDAVADRTRLACILGVASPATLDPAVAASPLLPRSLTVPPPDLERRTLLLQAALRRVPVADLDVAALAARTAGFSGADIVAAVVAASAMAAGAGTGVTGAMLATAIADTTPSLGSAPGGEVPAHGFEAVANLSEVKQRLTEAVIWPITDPGRFARVGIDPPRGLILSGPPGTGKTFVVRAVAHESGAAFFPVKGAELLDKFVGESERGVREIFARARAAAPSILFFDELDALAPVRGRSTTSVTDSVVAALLTEMDGISSRGDVVVIGATNRIDLIDPALLRAGRLETHLELGLPDREARRAMLAITDVRFAADVDLAAIAVATDGMSFADIAGLLREAALEALRQDATAISVTKAHLDAALARWRRSS